MSDIETASRRGRPRGFDADLGVAIAQTAFHRSGYDAIGVAELCALIGVRPPSLYAAYGSKRALFDRAVARYGAETGAEYDAAVAGAETIPGLRRAVLDTALRLYLRDGGTGCLVLGTLASTADTDLRRALSDVVASRRRVMSERLRTLGASEAEADAEVTAISIAMMGLSAGARAGLSEAELGAAVDRMS